MAATTAPSSKLSDELLKKLRETHSDYDDPAVDLEPILNVMEKILDDVHKVINGTHGGTVTPALDNGKLEAKLTDHIHRVSGELLCNCPREEDVDATILKLLETLKNFSWNTKMVIVLAAFTANLGEFGLHLQGGNTNSLATCVDFLWQVPKIELNALRDGVTKIVQAIRVAKCNSKFMMKLNHWYLSKKAQPISEDILEIIVRATYWTIHSVVGIARHFGWRKKNTSLTTEARLITQLENEVNQIYYVILKDNFNRFEKGFRKEMEDDYESLLKLMQTPGEGVIVEILKRFLFPVDINKDDIEKLRSKHVLFLISDLDISLEEITVLNELCQKEKSCEIVWFPVVDGFYDVKKFSELKKSMKWYTNVPLIPKPEVIKYIKEEWHFFKYPIAVLLTPEGRVTCPNAFPLLWTWGNNAFPFTAEKEKTLWPESCGWKLDFLVDDLIDAELRKWIIEGTLICLYGGGSIDWIEQFTTDVPARIGETVKMVYVGKNNANEWTGKVITEVQSPNLRVLKSERYFWARLWSMFYLYTKMTQGKTLGEDNSFMKEVMKIFAYDGSAGGWVLFCKADMIVMLEGEAALKIFKNSDWENYAKKHGFFEGLKYYMEYHTIPHSCIQLKLPFIGSEIPGKVQCFECGNEMEKYYLYRCCKE